MPVEYVIGPTVNLKRTIAPRGSGSGSGTAATRTVTGISSVFGNVDAGGDVVLPGAFTKAIQDFNAGRSRARFLWNHNASDPPVARILELKEIGKSDLPPVLRSNADAQGGLLVTRQYFTDPKSDQVYQGVASGAISEMSFAYNIRDFEYTNVKGQKVRLLKALDLLDLSDVNYGMNPATMAALPKCAVVLTVEKINKLKARKLEEIKMNEQIAQLNYFIKHGSRSAVDKNQMAVMDLKIRSLRLFQLSLPK
jgi:HK97 family phage prohead protease